MATAEQHQQHIEDGDALPSRRCSDAFTVRGVSSRIHPMATNSIGSVSTAFLLPWGRHNIMIDRYDVRQLLDSDDAAVRRMGEQEEDDSGEATRDAEEAETEQDALDANDFAEERKRGLREALMADEESSCAWTMQQLERERYRALHSERGRDEDDSSSSSGAEDSDDSRRRKRRKGDGGGRCWHFAYDALKATETEADSRNERKAGKEEDDISQASPPSSPPPPPFSPAFAVPIDIELVQPAVTQPVSAAASLLSSDRCAASAAAASLCVQPSSPELHELMAATAAFCVSSGHQAAILLKARTAAQPAFAFLHPEHRLQAYFALLKHIGPQLQAQAAAAVTAFAVRAEERPGSRTAAARLPASVSFPAAPPGMRRRVSAALETDVKVAVKAAAAAASGLLSPSAGQVGEEREADVKNASQASLPPAGSAHSAASDLAEQLNAAKARLLTGRHSPSRPERQPTAGERQTADEMG